MSVTDSDIIIMIESVLISCFLIINRQLQELESKFKEAYSQSLSNKDERIQVLEKRVEEMTLDNSQLRETLKKQSEKLKEVVQMNGESPAGSPSIKRMNSPRELSRLKEQAADAVKFREKLHRVQEDVC